MPPVRQIRKYANRKLYDEVKSSYISMLELSHLIAEGKKVSVFEDASGHDITFETLARALYERVKWYVGSADNVPIQAGRPSEPFPRSRLESLIQAISSLRKR